MIPVIGCAYITRSDLMLKMIMSINRPVNEIVIVDNSLDNTCPQVEGARTIKPYSNMGVSWAWNTIIHSTRRANYWVIVNSDVEMGPNDLANLEARMEAGDELCLVHSMALFGISASCVQKVGWFDEMFVPAYCEDNDYVYRARLLGVEVTFIEPEYAHYGSATIKSSQKFRLANDVSHDRNVKYYREKWGGVMHEETYTTPFDKGGSPRDTQTLDLHRLRELSWD